MQKLLLITLLAHLALASPVEDVQGLGKRAPTCIDPGSASAADADDTFSLASRLKEDPGTWTLTQGCGVVTRSTGGGVCVTVCIPNNQVQIIAKKHVGADVESVHRGCRKKIVNGRSRVGGNVKFSNYEVKVRKC